MERYEVRSASTTGEVAIIDKIDQRVEMVLSANALSEAFQLCDELNTFDKCLRDQWANITRRTVFNA